MQAFSKHLKRKSEEHSSHEFDHFDPGDTARRTASIRMKHVIPQARRAKILKSALRSFEHKSGSSMEEKLGGSSARKC